MKKKKNRLLDRNLPLISTIIWYYVPTGRELNTKSENSH